MEIPLGRENHQNHLPAIRAGFNQHLRFLPEGQGALLILWPRSPQQHRCLVSHFLCSSDKSGLCHHLSLQPGSSAASQAAQAAQPLSVVCETTAQALSLRHPPSQDPFLTTLHKILLSVLGQTSHKGWSYLLFSVKELAWPHGCLPVMLQWMNTQQSRGILPPAPPQPHNPIRDNWRALTASVGRRGWQAGSGCTH